MSAFSRSEAEKERRLQNFRKRLDASHCKGRDTKVSDVPDAGHWTLKYILVLVFGIAFYHGRDLIPWPPELWYLSWRPGVLENTRLATYALAVPLTILLGIALAKPSFKRVIASAIAFTAFSATLSDVSLRWSALNLGLAQIECFMPGTYDCVLNEFHRMYDLGWRREMTRSETSAYLRYAALRERAKLKRPPIHSSWKVFAAHHRNRNDWVARFTPELRDAMRAFPPSASVRQN